jgi:hypothetical protein
MIDVVYILGPGSKWNDNELKYSVRSVLKHLKNYGRIWIVGNKPKCKLDAPAIFIPIDPNPRKHKNANIRDALREIAKTGECSDWFIYMNDDFFFTKDVEASKIPNYFCGTLGARSSGYSDKSAGYWRTIVYTYGVLAALGYSTRDYEVHGPILMKKSLLLEALDLKGTEPLLQIRSIYANAFPGKNEVIRDCKFGTYPDPKLTKEKMYETIAERPFFSIGDELTDEQKAIFEELYPCNSATYDVVTFKPALEKVKDSFTYMI